LPARSFLAFLLLRYRKRQMSKITTTTVATTTAMTITVVLLLSAETRILYPVRHFSDFKDCKIQKKAN